jgi:hypothetical protein
MPGAVPDRQQESLRVAYPVWACGVNSRVPGVLFGDTHWSSSDHPHVPLFPQRDTFNQDAETVARTMASKKVRPKGIGSGIRMIQYFINRAGKNLSATHKRELEKAKRILQERAERETAKPAAHSKRRTRSREPLSASVAPCGWCRITGHLHPGVFTQVQVRTLPVSFKKKCPDLT